MEKQKGIMLLNLGLIFFSHISKFIFTLNFNDFGRFTFLVCPQGIQKCETSIFNLSRKKGNKARLCVLGGFAI